MNEIKDLCDKLRPVFGEVIDQYESRYVIEDRNGKSEIKQWLEILYHKTFKDGKKEEPILVPPPREAWNSCNGPYVIGSVIYNDKIKGIFGLRGEEFLSHLLIVGRSGSGKTNVVFQLIKELFANKKPFWIFDWKRNYRDLLQINNNLLVYTIGRDVSNFQFNPLIPLSTEDAKTRIKHFTRWICKAYYLGEGAASILEKGLNYLFDKFGIYKNDYVRYPTPKDLLSWLEKFNPDRREKDWLQSTTRAIKSLCFGLMGEIVNCQNQIPFKQLINHNVVFELDAMNKTEKVFFKEALLYSRHAYKLSQPEREIFQDVIIVEEAHHLLKKKQSNEEDILETTLREERELGTGIVIIDQQASDLSDTAFANTATTIALNQKSRKDINQIANSLLLSDDQKENLGKLPVGYAIIKMQHRPGCTTPMLVKCRHVKIKKGLVDDKQIQKHMANESYDNNEGDKEPNIKINTKDPSHIAMKKCSTLSKHFKPTEIAKMQKTLKRITNEIGETVTALKTIQSKKDNDKNSDDKKEKEAQIDSKLPETSSAQSISTDSRIFTDVYQSHIEKEEGEGKYGKQGKQPKDFKLLLDIYEHPYSGVVQRYKRLEINRKTGNTLKHKLIKEELIEQEEIKENDGRRIILKLTKRGDELLKQHSLPPKFKRRNGGLEHRYWKDKIAKYYQDKHGLKATIEKRLTNGHICDILLENEKTGKAGAIEIETGKSKHILNNLQGNIDYGLHYITFVATNEKAYEKIKQELEKHTTRRDVKIVVMHPDELKKLGDRNER